MKEDKKFKESLLYILTNIYLYNIYAACRRRWLVGSPAGERRTPELQGHWSRRGGVRCRGEGERAKRERMGGRKKGKEKKRGKGRWGCGLAGPNQLFPNMWHSATSPFGDVRARD
jgi:hypothetical protein